MPIILGGALTIANSGSGTLTLGGGITAANPLTFAGSGATSFSGPSGGRRQCNDRRRWGVTISAPVSLGHPITLTNNGNTPLNLSGGVNENSNLLTIAGTSATSIGGITNGVGLTLNPGAGNVTITTHHAQHVWGLHEQRKHADYGIDRHGARRLEQRIATDYGTRHYGDQRLYNRSGHARHHRHQRDGHPQRLEELERRHAIDCRHSERHQPKRFGHRAGAIQHGRVCRAYTSIHLNNPAGMTIGNTFYLSGDGTAETNSGDGIGSLYAWGPGILQNDAGNNILSGGTLGLIQNSGNAVIKVNAGSLDIQDPVALNTPFGASSRDVFFGGVSSGTIDGAITDGGYSEALSFTKVDSGSWTLTNTANSFYGFLKVANGTLAVATLNGNGLGAITLGSTTSNESATLRFIGSGTDANPITNAVP